MRAELEQLARIEGLPATIADMNAMLDRLALPGPRLLFKIVTKLFGEVSATKLVGSCILLLIPDLQLNPDSQKFFSREKECCFRFIALFDSERGPLKHALMKLGDEAARLHNGSARQIANIAKDTCASYADSLNLHPREDAGYWHSSRRRPLLLGGRSLCRRPHACVILCLYVAHAKCTLFSGILARQQFTGKGDNFNGRVLTTNGLRMYSGVPMVFVKPDAPPLIAEGFDIERAVCFALGDDNSAVGSATSFLSVVLSALKVTSGDVTGGVHGLLALTGAGIGLPNIEFLVSH
jgi:hypothetical protein